MKKKSTHKLIHPSFPDQGTVQPAHMGSQSQTPVALDPSLALQGPTAPQMPGDTSTNTAPQGEY